MHRAMFHRLIAVALVLFCAFPAFGQFTRDKAANKKIDEAINTHYFATDFDKAEGVLLGTVEACGDKCSPQTLGRAWMYIGVVRGSGKFVVARAEDDEVRAADSAGEQACPENLETFVLSERKPQLLVVPPGHWHGWMALEDETIVVATGSEVYNRQDPDELRVSPAVFGDVWTVKGR